MNKLWLAMAAVLLFFSFDADAQGRKKRPTKKQTKAPAVKETLVPAGYEIYVTPVKDVGILFVGVTPLSFPEGSDISFQAFLRDHFGVKELTLRNVRRDLPKVVVRFDADDDIETLIKAVEVVSVSDKVVVELEAYLEDARFVVPRKLTDREILDVKPNPLTLLVRMDEQKRLTLNGEAMGSLSDTSRLITFLKDVFRQRTENGVFRENSHEIEKTVFIKMSLAASAGDLIKIGKALEEAGADPIGFKAFENDEAGDLIDIPPILPSAKPRR